MVVRMNDKETSRVEAFSDGVFGIAMTLLVLEFKVPHIAGEASQANASLMRSLLELWPSFVAFVLSFGTILIMWVNHHGLFKHARRADNRLLFANGFLLLLVTFVPFPTAVLAAYLDTPAATTAATFYCATFVFISLGYYVLFLAIMRHHHPKDAAAKAVIARIRRAYLSGFAVYVTATLVSVFNAFAGLAICCSLWALWILRIR